MSNSSAARTNLTSNSVQLNPYQVLGEGSFRIAYAATYIGGNRNSQEAVAKCFKPRYKIMETEYFESDFEAADKAIQYAEEWNTMCANPYIVPRHTIKDIRTILITRGDIHTIGGTKYLVEPLIRGFTKFTSNNGWISDNEKWQGKIMEAFTHYTYHRSGGNLIVCDLQGRHKRNTYEKHKSRFELTDVAICSRNRRFGPTDLGEKGIDSFFDNHVCNEFCNVGGHWARPKNTRAWFPKQSSTSMMRSSQSNLLQLTNRSTFQPGFGGILEEEEEDEEEEDNYTTSQQQLLLQILQNSETTQKLIDILRTRY
mmetsp:Transcript_4050/g.10276  ORF Transcript_4050/g.10276 Transcript_4050/m.10276 type:complete len:312 (-) Transcript_4050:87-1022(-)